MSKTPLVSILINCFNSQQFIEECILSVINQTYKNIEIVIWDNSSKDNTANIVKSLNDKRIKYFKNTSHVSLGEARIQATNYLNGDFIAILDSDDLAYKNRILDQVNYLLRNNDIGLVGGWMNIINKDSKIINTYKPEFFKYNLNDQICWSNPLIHSSIMYRKSAALKLKWYSIKITNFQDYQLIIKISLNYKIININKIMGAKRNHKYNSIKNTLTYNKQLKDYKLLLRYVRLYIPKEKTFLRKMNTNSLKVNELKLLIFSFSTNKNIKNLFNIFLYILKNPIVLSHNGYIRKFINI